MPHVCSPVFNHYIDMHLHMNMLYGIFPAHVPNVSISEVMHRCADKLAQRKSRAFKD